MPTPPPALPADPLVGSFLRRKRTWSERYVANAIAIFNRWSTWLDRHGVDLVDVTGDDCATFLAQRAAGTTDLVDQWGRPLGPVAGSTLHKDWQMLVWLYTWLVREG